MKVADTMRVQISILKMELMAVDIQLHLSFFV
jgi:hypothetical protein